MSGESTPDRVVDTPPLFAYRQLVYDEAERLYELAVLLVEDPKLAMELVRRSLDRTWTSLQKRQIYMDIDEAACWGVVREAVRRRGKSSQVRAFQPSTTGDDRQITAVGVISGFSPEQSAAVYQVARFGSSYQFAGAISGIGEQRARDIVYSARQEFRDGREPFVPISNECSRMAPRISAQGDNQVASEDAAEIDRHVEGCGVCQSTRRLYQDFTSAVKELRLPPAGVDVVEEGLAISTARPDEAPRGWRRITHIFSGPWGLVPFFIVGAVVLQQCTPPPVPTGVGRTSDIVFAHATDGKGILALESGSGQELSRWSQLPAGLVSPSGFSVYSRSFACDSVRCQTTLSVTDTGTGAATTIGTLEGNLHVVALDGLDRLFLADEDANWNRLVAIRLSDASVQGSVVGPPGTEGSFGPRRALIRPTGEMLTLAQRSSGEGLVVVATDLRNLRASAVISLDSGSAASATLALSANAQRIFVYLPAGPTFLEVNRSLGQRVRSLSLSKGEGPGAFAPTSSTLMVLDPGGQSAYCVLPTGGVAVVRLDTFEVDRQLGGERRFRSIGVSTDGESLYTLGFDGTYRVLEASTGKEKYSKGQVRADDILQVNTGD